MVGSAAQHVSSLASVSRSGRIVRALVAVVNSSFDGSAFLVIVPGFNQQVRRRISRAVIAAKDLEAVFKSAAAAVGDAAILAPGRLAVIESRPYRAHCNFVGMMLGHVVVEILQVVLTPIAAIARPAAIAGLHPGIKAIEGIEKPAALDLVDEQRRIGPASGRLTHAIPVSAGVFGKDKDHRLTLIP